MSNKYAEISRVKIRTLNKDGKTILDDVYFTSPFKVAPPFYKSDDFIKVIIMSSSAGTLEGDVQDYDITLGDNTKMELTSQSFEKIHTMIDEEATRDCDIYIGKNSFFRYNSSPERSRTAVPGSKDQEDCHYPTGLCYTSSTI